MNIFKINLIFIVLCYLKYNYVNCVCDFDDYARQQYYIPISSKDKCHNDCYYFEVTYQGVTSMYCSVWNQCQRAQISFVNLPLTVSTCQKGTGSMTIGKFPGNEFCDIYLENGVNSINDCKQGCYYISYGQGYSKCQQCTSNYNQILEYYPAQQIKSNNNICEYGYGTGQNTIIFGMASKCYETNYNINEFCYLYEKVWIQNNQTSIEQFKYTSQQLLDIINQQNQQNQQTQTNKGKLLKISIIALFIFLI